MDDLHRHGATSQSNWWSRQSDNNNSSISRKNIHSFHEKVEEVMSKQKNLYDFGDFKSAIDRRGTAVEMNVDDLVLWENGI